jgi:hypothetical protein
MISRRSVLKCLSLATGAALFPRSLAKADTSLPVLPIQ